MMKNKLKMLNNVIFYVVLFVMLLVTAYVALDYKQIILRIGLSIIAIAMYAFLLMWAWWVVNEKV